ncbi:methylated-DNA--[protein]-cysteine S-methyltransferase [Pedomonas mirosovicensis]|uniref:methylated-DNA--[protein]-cysteine S-methyltransferase n=1 Tax=Pedomonas mirosovicensis TaxID=2908641 RepID=UPI002168A18C|nr:methylated-DNA--[protein]-cysteine S-methyltransferase [Pedomonas mirosovicensis]MCH8684109.1 methylated-DNA--[protein]-cysteine S-methyltransferase [Pedomonas mirosovicensis]
MPTISLHTPIGDITVCEDEGQIVAVEWGWGSEQEETPLLREAREQLDAYFDGKLQNFALPLAPYGTPRRQQIWQAMSAIPYGQTKTYGQIANEIGTAARAVGQACARNPIPILIPCHRVLSATPSRDFYSFGEGTETKTMLLRLEGALGH